MATTYDNDRRHSPTDRVREYDSDRRDTLTTDELVQRCQSQIGVSSESAFRHHLSAASNGCWLVRDDQGKFWENFDWHSGDGDWHSVTGLGFRGPGQGGAV